MNDVATSVSDESTLIRAWGESWSRRAIDWKSGKIKAERRHFRKFGKEQYVDIWKQRGIYALEKDFKIVYVGQANDRDLGQRLREHTADHLRQRWDTFSWYGLLPMDSAGTLLDYTSQEVDKTSIIRTLELVGILMSDAPLNRSRGKVPGAEKMVQHAYRKIRDVHGLLEDVLEELDVLKKKLDRTT